MHTTQYISEVICGFVFPQHLWPRVPDPVLKCMYCHVLPALQRGHALSVVLCVMYLFCQRCSVARPQCGTVCHVPFLPALQRGPPSVWYCVSCAFSASAAAWPALSVVLCVMCLFCQRCSVARPQCGTVCHVPFLPVLQRGPPSVWYCVSCFVPIHSLCAAFSGRRWDQRFSEL